MDKADMRLLLAESLQAQQYGAKAAEVSLIRSVVAALVEQLPTTAQLTKHAPTVDDPWGVWESTPPMTKPSLPSDQAGTQNGPVEHNSECAQPSAWVVKYTSKDLTGWVQALELYCQVHHVSWWFGRTPAQGVDQTLSTSVKQPLKESVENSQKESVQLQLKESSEGWCELHTTTYPPSERAIHMLRYPSHKHGWSTY